MQLVERWKRTWQRIEKVPPDALYTELSARYAEPQRAYHTFQHIGECFALFESVRHLAEKPVEVELAIWFHDVIYDPKASDNEERSAAFALKMLHDNAVDPAQSARVVHLINATKHTQLPIGVDAQLLVDVDLSILGADADRFDEYEEQIRFEYGWVPWPEYCTRRAELLRRFLARPTIFAFEHFIIQRENRARQNIRRSLARLKSAKYLL